MFSAENRVIYTKNQLGEVICQLRFPEILSISTNPPADFQEAIRADYPRYSALREPIPAQPGVLPARTQPGINHQFLSADGIWRVNLTSKFISLACSRYTKWEDFASRLDKPLAAFIQTYKPAYFERIGLRYLNFISRKDLGLDSIPFSDLIAPCYLGLLAEEDVQESSAIRSTVDADIAIRGGCRMKVHAGPGMVRRAGAPQQDKELKFIFDMDLYIPGQLAVNLSAGALQTLHAQAWPVFRGGITDTLHDALSPDF
ncbi:MAG: TIGR04255 family protein [Oscillospiraceae bacterium]|nr:TIGR04255 family protein [Oscillospiraceae bacterium]